MIYPMGEPDAVKGLQYLLASALIVGFGIDERQLKVLVYCRIRQEVAALKDETEFLVAKQSLFHALIFKDVLVLEEVDPRGGRMEKPQDVEKSGLAGP
jgi:hypothetical protein